MTDTDWEKLHKRNLATRRNWLTGAAQLIKCVGHKERYFARIEFYYGWCSGIGFIRFTLTFRLRGKT